MTKRKRTQQRGAKEPARQASPENLSTLALLISRDVGTVMMSSYVTSLADACFYPRSEPEQRELERDQAHMQDRLRRIDQELKSEPEAIRALFEVVQLRLEPVGLVYLWPATKA